MRRLLVIVFLGLIAVAGVSEYLASAQTETITFDELEGLPPQIAVTVRGAEYQRDAIVLYNWQIQDVTTIADSAGDDSHATWSPDGTQLALQTTRDGDWEIYVVDVATGDARNITQSRGSSDMYPNWSPDGDVVHYSTRSGQDALWLTNPVDLTAQDLTSADDCRPDYHPSISPQGDVMAYRADCTGNGDIHLLDFASGVRTNLTADSPRTDRYPAFSPDGEQILFVSARDGNEEIYVMDADGNNVRNLTQNSARDKQGSWSPDGRFIIFISDRNGTDDVWIMDADGGRPTLLLAGDSNTAYDWPWWQPMTEEELMENGQGNADVTFVRASLNSNGTWTFSVTVSHPDTGWEDYADGWDVVLPDGTVILPDSDSPFTRLLLHPHVNEQPFTRSQSGIVIPVDVTTVTVRAHDIVDGFGGQEVVVDLNATTGENFEVQR